MPNDPGGPDFTEGPPPNKPNEPQNEALDEYGERSMASGRLLPGFVAASMLLAARVDPNGPEGQRWDSYVIRGGVPTTLALAAQLVVDLPHYLIQGPQHVTTPPLRSTFTTYQAAGHQNAPPGPGAFRELIGTTMPQNAVETLGVHLEKGTAAAWGQLQEVFSRVCLLGAVIDSARVYTFIRLWYPVGVPDARSMGSIALFADWALANLLSKSMQPHFRQSIAARVYAELPGSLDSIDGG